MASANQVETTLHDVEAQRQNEKAHDPSTTSSEHPSVSQTKLSEAECLRRFRERIGIVNPTAASDPNFEFKKRPGRNEGTYRRTVHAERRARFQYQLAASAINLCLLVQIVIGAVQTALGASNAPHTAITVLGALQTVIAGALTYMKGQGLPNRLRQSRNEMQKLRVHIEKVERQMREPGCELDLEQEITIIENKYEAIVQNYEDNNPENFVGVGPSPQVGPGGKIEPFLHLPRGLGPVTPVTSILPSGRGFGGVTRATTIGTVPDGSHRQSTR